MAVLMSPTEHANLWNSEVKIHRLGNTKCKCFVMGGMASSRDTLWRLRPEFSLSARPPGKRYRRIVGMNSWMRFHAKRPPVHTRRSRVEEVYLPLSQSGLTDTHVIPNCRKSDSLESKQSSDDLTVRTGLYTSDMDNAIYKGSRIIGTFLDRGQPIEEPWLLQPNSNNIDTLSFNDKRYDSYQTNQPVEEPWLFEGSVFLSSNTKVISNQECFKDEATIPEVCDHPRLATKNSFPEYGNNEIAQEDSVSTVILHNSSACSMHRIAVLEDGKLVELILEPVKNNIQCDSIYLGVVLKLVPRMGSAFVTIGRDTNCLLKVIDNREPFVFPPFRLRRKKREVNGSASIMPEETQNMPSNVEAEDEIDEVDIKDVSLLDEYTDHETGDDYDFTEGLKENVNGSLPRHGEAAADVDGCADLLVRNINVEGCSDNSPPYQLRDKKVGLMESNGDENKWDLVQKGTKIICQVTKEKLGGKGPELTAYPKLRSRFWVLMTRCNTIGISAKISSDERARLRTLAINLRPYGFGLIVRTSAAGHSSEELKEDLEGLLSTWKHIMEHAKAVALTADEGMEGASNVMLHSAKGQTLSIVQDYFSEEVKKMVIDSPRIKHEVTSYLQEKAPSLCDRVELYEERTPLFDKYNIESEMSNILSKRVPLGNGGDLVIEETAALVAVDVNSGNSLINTPGQGTSPEEAKLSVNLAAAKQIARELRLRNLGGLIAVDFIAMDEESNRKLVYEEVKRAVQRDRSKGFISELSKNGLMEITRKRVRPSVTFMITEPCSCCQGTGRVEALETLFSKIEREFCRLFAMMNVKADPENTKSCPRFLLQLDSHMFSYLTSEKRKKLADLESCLKVSILPEVASGFTRGKFQVKPLRDAEDLSNSAHRRKNQVAFLGIAGLQRPGNLSNRKFSIKKSKSGRK